VGNLEQTALWGGKLKFFGGFEMKRRMVLVAMVIGLFLCVSMLYAQSNATLKSGVYNFSGNSGAGKVVIQLSTNYRNVIVYGYDGNVTARGTLRITGTQVKVDFGNNGFEIWTIVDNETFKDGNGLTFYWVRNYRNDEL
jgi:hypothetical protein